jgi:hypothetical protein
MVLRRYTITVADLKSGIERRATVFAWPVFAVLTAVIFLPLLVAFAATWQARVDMQRLSARHRALEIETANYRAALERLIAQVRSDRATNGDGRAAAAASPQPTRLDSPPATSLVSATPAPLSHPDSLRQTNSSAAAAAGASAIGNTPAPAPSQARESSSRDAIAPGPPAASSGVRDGGPETTARESFQQALAGVSRARVLAEVAEAPALASRSYEAGLTLELEAHDLSGAGRANDALARAVEAGARFRAAEIEARAEAAAAIAWERVTLADTPVATPHRSLADTPQLPVTSAGGTEEMIRDVIAQYVRGLESRNLATLKRVWPSLGGTQERAIQTEFENARTVRTQFTDPRITVNGDITTVTGFRMYSLVTQDGQRLSSVTRTTMTLRRNGDAWVIERVVHQQ